MQEHKMDKQLSSDVAQFVRNVNRIIVFTAYFRFWSIVLYIAFIAYILWSTL